MIRPRPRASACTVTAGPNRDGRLPDDISQKTGKRILLEFGGEWCSWCHILDKYFRDNPTVTTLRDRHYVTSKSTTTRRTRTRQFSCVTLIRGYPHFFVLDSDGKFLHSQDTYKLEEGEGYSSSRLTAILDEEWAAGRR